MEPSKPQPSNVKVFCRFRPLNKMEQNTGSELNMHRIHSENHLLIKSAVKDDELTFVFDKIFDSESGQEDIYQEVGAPILTNILDGYNGTIIAYGQTSSGKTHTIQGSSEPNGKGIIPRIVKQCLMEVENLFIAIENSEENIEFKLKVSILELYMEKLYDLIDVSKTDLKIRESKQNGNFVENKTEIYISDKFELNKLINLAQKNRVTCVTNMNANSSRSHLIFQLTLSQFNSDTQQAKTSNLFIVDLAGSEKVSKTGAEGKTLEQAKKINLSLTCLAKVIKSLSENIPHIPYRDSKLTRIVQNSLGGNSKTSLILTCSPHESNIHETISTLRFGETAQKIKNKPKINRELTVQELQSMIVRLEAKIKAKDRWIFSLEEHLRKLGVGLPRRVNFQLDLIPDLKNEKLYSTTDINDISPTNDLLEHVESADFWEAETNFSQYISTLNIPHLAVDEEEQAKDEQVLNLEKELSDCKMSLQNETNKHYILKKEFNDLSKNLKIVIQENIEYQFKQAEMNETITSLKSIMKECQHKGSHELIECEDEEDFDKCEQISEKLIEAAEENFRLSKVEEELRIHNRMLEYILEYLDEKEKVKRIKSKNSNK